MRSTNRLASSAKLLLALTVSYLCISAGLLVCVTDLDTVVMRGLDCCSIIAKSVHSFILATLSCLAVLD
ncbi:hypothetical protein Ddye_004946 [Dipteronia dyeriana]|uniref:Uncharacterized protein n=1 Tax=Dipteronia dyeriana TaxID=168575 RepID=A0AAD9XFF8_9ROSI|nr:hypothetical protein Ddye_004946 [Dipteronia dyeriana]